MINSRTAKADDPLATETFIRRRVRCAVALSAVSVVCYGALVLGMAAFPGLLRVLLGNSPYSVGLALVALNVVAGSGLSGFYVWWMRRQSAGPAALHVERPAGTRDAP